MTIDQINPKYPVLPIFQDLSKKTILGIVLNNFSPPFSAMPHSHLPTFTDFFNLPLKNVVKARVLTLIGFLQGWLSTRRIRHVCDG